MLISPFKADLGVTGTSPTYINTAWANDGHFEAVGSIYRDRPDANSPYRDYFCVKAGVASINHRPYSDPYCWRDLGLSATSGGYAPNANVRPSNSDAWASGQTIALGQDVYDVQTHHDYIAAVAIAGGSNTTRPSAAILSTDPAVAARWVDLGAANAWAPFDERSNTYLEGINTSGAAITPVTFTFVANTSGPGATHLFLAGLENVESVSATLTVTVTTTGAAWGGTMVDPTPVTLAHGVLGALRDTAILPFTPVPKGHTLSVAVTLATANLDGLFPMRCAVCGVGYGYELAHTEWGVEASVLDFSRRDRDETFGTVTFIKRGSAKTLRATCFIDPAEVSGDVIHQILKRHTGQPVMLDFNNQGGSDPLYDRLRVYGFYTNLRTLISASSFESLSIDVEGLVE